VSKIFKNIFKDDLNAVRVAFCDRVGKQSVW